jgi:hypothetical protein
MSERLFNDVVQIGLVVHGVDDSELFICLDHNICEHCLFISVSPRYHNYGRK